MLNENIKAIRKSKGLSQQELAVRLNVVRQTISKWEQGVSPIRLIPYQASKLSLDLHDPRTPFPSFLTFSEHPISSPRPPGRNDLDETSRVF